MSFWDLFKTVKKPKKKEREKWLKQVEKAKGQTKANASRSRKSASPKPHKTTSAKSTPSYSSSRRGGYVSTNVQKRARTQSDNTLKAHSAYSARLKKEREAENRKAVKALQNYTGHKYKNNEEIKGTIYTGDPEQNAEYSLSAKVKDQNADKTVYDKKTGKAKGVTLKEYYSQKEHQKEAQKEKKQIEKFVNDNPFAAGFGNAYSKLVGRGVEDYKDIFKNVKGEDGKKGLNTKKYDKSSAAKVGNVLGTVSQYVVTGGTGGAYKAGASATAKALGKLTAKKGAKALAKTAAKTAAKTTAKNAAKNAAKKGAKKLTKEGLKKFGKDRAAEIAADMPLDIAHAAKDSKGDTKDFWKEMGLNVAMNIGAGAGVSGIGRVVKGAKVKSAVKKAAKKATTDRKETAKVVKQTLEALDERAKDQGDYLSELRTQMGVKEKPTTKITKGKPVKQVTLKNKETGEVLAKGTPRTKLEKQTMVKAAVKKAGGVENVATEVTEVAPRKADVPETQAPQKQAPAKDEAPTEVTTAPREPEEQVPEEVPAQKAPEEVPAETKPAKAETPKQAIKRLKNEQKELDAQYSKGEVSANEYKERTKAISEERETAEIDAEWKDKGKEYGTYDKSNTPKQTDEQTHVNKALDTAMSEKPGKEGIVQDERVKQNIKKSVLEQEVGFTRKSQKEALDAAEKRVAKDPDKVQNTFNESMSATDTDVANGVALYKHYMEQGDIEAASDVIRKVSMQLTEAGRGINAAKLLMRTTPAGRVKAAQGLAEKLTDKYAKRLKGEEITVSPETLKKINDAVTEDEINAANELARVEIWNQIPASWAEKFNAWRYISMLGNPKTHIRNIVGNALFAVPREIKNIIGSGVESLMDKAGLIAKGERTKALINLAKKEDRELLDFGAKNFDANEPILRGQSRWNDSSRPDDSVVFKNPILEKLRKLNGGVLDKEDVMFMKPAYKMAMARYMKANGYTAADMTGEVLKKAENVASDEALKATYRDASAFAEWLSKMKNPGPNATKGRKVAAAAVESMVPFAKTPTNILRRGVEYSPVGLLHGLIKMGKSIAKKDGDELVKGIDRMASGLTGTGVLGLGYFLNRNGIVTVKAETDAEGNYKKDLGEQNFAIKFGDSSYTLDWAAPMSMPFFVGAAISDQTQDSGLTMEKALNSFGDMMNPVVEMSMLQGLTNTVSAFNGYGSGVDVPGGLMSVGTNYFTQAAPTFAGQLARVFDDTQRSTTSTREGTVSRTLDRAQKQVRAKIPFLSKTLQPAVDGWGREKKYGSNTERVLENFFSPGYYSEDKSTAVDKGLLKLAGDLSDDEKNKIFPKGLTGDNLSFQGNDVRVDPKSLTMYNKVKGKEAYKQVKELMKTDAYKAMSAPDKAKAISNIYSDAGVIAKQETLIGMGKDKFKVRTDDWKNEDDIKAAKKYSAKHDIDDIIDVNKELQDLGFPTTRSRQPNLKALAVAESGNANKDLYNYFNIDNATRKLIKGYRKAGGSLEELGNTQKSIEKTAKTIGKGANDLPKPALGYALSKAGGANRIYQMYDESTVNSKNYWEHSVRSGKGMAATGLTLKDRQKAYDATKGANGHPTKDAIVNYLDKQNWTQEQKSYMFWQLANWNTSENPYGEYTPKFKAKKSKNAGKPDWSNKKTQNEFRKAAEANANDEFWTRYKFAKQAQENAKSKKNVLYTPYNDEDYIPKRTLQSKTVYDEEGINEIKKILGGYPKRMGKRIEEAAKKSPKTNDDAENIYSDGKEGSSSGGGGGYYRRYGRGGRGGRGGSSGGKLDFPELKTAKTPSVGTSKSKSVDWSPKAVSTKQGWTDAQIRKVFKALINQGLTQEQAVSRIASLWNTRFGG